MRVQALLPLVSLYLVSNTVAAPLHSIRKLGSGIEAVLFDAPAVSSKDGTVASAEVFTFSTSDDDPGLADVLHPILAPLSLLGIDANEALDTALDRLRLFSATPEGGQAITIDVDGCSKPAVLTGTDNGSGLAVQNVPVGNCNGEGKFSGQIEGGGTSTPMTVFPSPDSGFGVISDIDDTTKISNVLNKLKLAKATLFDEPEPVPGMPELYANLSISLNQPSFTFVTGSPYQLVPFLRDFLSTTYSATPGAILAKNLTLSNIDQLGRFLFDGNDTKNFKLSQIQRLKGLWPNKTFLTVGDSGEKDPETYGEAFRTHGGDFIQCIWIRAIDEADNSDARFAAAFQGVPKDRIRIYSDDDIVNVLPNIDVAGGSC